jgi:hypothetical protein
MMEDAAASSRASSNLGMAHFIAFHSQPLIPGYMELDSAVLIGKLTSICR